MARNGDQMTEDELDAFETAMDEQADELYEALAEDLGGEPADYEKRPLPDGGE